MTDHNIYIFTRAVRSGKTTTLQQWLRNNNVHAGGILTPDIEGKRMLYDIAENQFYHMEAEDDMPDSECLLVGRYRFLKRAFAIGREILERDLERQPEWMIIDEVGTLELQENTGLEPSVTHVINSYNNSSHSKKLMLVIRNYLLDEACERYGLNTDMIINDNFFE
ncbi:nucleoside-triphosphatase [Polluticoccus soli]|uniref:nucleoside-triphosphatase n=1 Tax=Polluticoccus soli TaxID=3034150 RepID=UPI0023E1A384|nr:nucleoside-triphosphatase [Flavipsychrobacter sp. JY13-12]